MVNNALEVKSLSFRYNEIKNVFNNLNFNIKNGDFVYLIITNNSGKTTLINILNGYPYDGEVYINDIELNCKNKSQIYKYMNIIDKNSIRECKLTGLMDEIKKISKDKYESYLKDYETLCINSDDYRNLRIFEKIKCLIFINLIRDYSLLIIDEIIDMLNSKDKDIIYKLLKKYQKMTKKTVIIISNNADGIMYARRTLVLNEGIICFDGTIKDIGKDDNVFNELAIKLPFLIDLSLKLKLYDLIDKVYVDEKRMIKDIWKK